jgi:hypothetical protein
LFSLNLRHRASALAGVAFDYGHHHRCNNGHADASFRDLGE